MQAYSERKHGLGLGRVSEFSVATGILAAFTALKSRSDTPSDGMARLFYIDNLRGVLTMLVVWHHSALAVSGLGRWYYCMTRGHEEAVSFAVLATLLFTSEAFLTSLLFTIAGLLVPKSLQAKGVYKYLLRRIWRLGLPVLCVGLPIHHLCKWLGHRLKATKGEDEMSLGFSGPGVAWFQLWLLTFECFWVLLRGRLKFGKGVGRWTLALGILSLALLQLAMDRILARPMAGLLPYWRGLPHHLIHTPLYFFCFLCGCLAGSPAKLRVHARPLGIACASAIVVCFVFALERTGSREERASDVVAAAIGAIMTVLICMGMSLHLLLHFQESYDSKSRLSGLADLSYAVNMLHPLLVVLFSPVVEALPLGLFGRCVLLWTLSTCFSIASAGLVQSLKFL